MENIPSPEQSKEELMELERSQKRKKPGSSDPNMELGTAEEGEDSEHTELRQKETEGERRHNRAVSYKERLMGNIEDTFREVFFPEHELDEHTGMEEDCAGEGEDSDEVKISYGERLRIRQIWKHSIIVKLFGGTISYNLLAFKLNKLWRVSEGFELISLGHGFHVVRLKNVEEIEKILRGGPWFVNGRFLTMRWWEPNFRASEASISTTAVWVRLPELPIEYYDMTILHRIGGAIGPVLLVDAHTCAGTRGRFARICIQIDLEKPLKTSVKIGNASQDILYEGIEKLCFTFGMIGHESAACKQGLVESSDMGREAGDGGSERRRKEAQRSATKPTNQEGSRGADRPDSFGPWLIVKDRRRGGRP